MENNLYMLIGELTVEQFIDLCGHVFVRLLIFCIFVLFLYHFLLFILNFVYGLIRKDKYNSTDFAVIEAHRYIARLRRQVKFAPDSETFVIQYNRLVGAVAFLVHMGYIKSEFSTKILNVIPEFYSKDDE